jgi:glyoxalase family protein
MNISVNGIHHVTAISGDAQKNVDFYSGVLGLRMLKKTVNFDDPHTYHLYFGDESGNPGTILTFFPWGNHAQKGKKGNGQLTTISFSADSSGLDFWEKRLTDLKIDFSGPFKRNNNEIILFEDTDGIELELVFNQQDNRTGWENDWISAQYAIKGFYGVTLTEEKLRDTSPLLEDHLGFKLISEDEDRHVFQSARGEPGGIVEISIQPNAFSGRMGVGAVHHVAWRTENDETQTYFQESLTEKGFSVTPIIDRNYFHSIYFREPGGVLFEIATDPPGFLIDEKKEELGTHLKLPPWYESKRKEIEKALPAITLPYQNKVKNV